MSQRQHGPENPLCPQCGAVISSVDSAIQSSSSPDRSATCPNNPKDLPSSGTSSYKESNVNFKRFIAFLLISIGSIIVWYLSNAPKFPWFVLVIGLYLVVWEIVYFNELIVRHPEEVHLKAKRWWYMHLSVCLTVNCVIFVIWYFHWNDFGWAFIIMGILCVVCTLHWSYVYRKSDTIWLAPQLLIFTEVNAMNFCLWYFNGRSNTLWFLWLALVWAAVIMVEVTVYGMVKLIFYLKTRSLRNYLTRSRLMEGLNPFYSYSSTSTTTTTATAGTSSGSGSNRDLTVFNSHDFKDTHSRVPSSMVTIATSSRVLSTSPQIHVIHSPSSPVLPTVPFNGPATTTEKKSFSEGEVNLAHSAYVINVEPQHLEVIIHDLHTTPPVFN
jgi:ABC-type antimicrobial peptide transport system permease subunit